MSFLNVNFSSHWNMSQSKVLQTLNPSTTGSALRIIISMKHYENERIHLPEYSEDYKTGPGSNSRRIWGNRWQTLDGNSNFSGLGGPPALGNKSQKLRWRWGRCVVVEECEMFDVIRYKWFKRFASAARSRGICLNPKITTTDLPSLVGEVNWVWSMGLDPDDPGLSSFSPRPRKNRSKTLEYFPPTSPLHWSISSNKGSHRAKTITLHHLLKWFMILKSVHSTGSRRMHSGAEPQTF